MATETEAALLLKLQASKVHGPLITVLLFLEAAISSELVKAVHDKKSWKSQQSAEALALWNASYELQGKSIEYARRLTDRGLLPFAFAGTTVLEGGAA